VSLPAAYAGRLRTGDPAVVGRVERGRCLLDLRCVPAGRRLRGPARRRAGGAAGRTGVLRVHVVATAGHVDQGKSSLVWSLTGWSRTAGPRSAAAA